MYIIVNINFDSVNIYLSCFITVMERDQSFGPDARDFDQRVQRLLNDEDYISLDSDSSVVDDSDADPDFNSSDEESQSEVDESSDDEDVLLEDSVGVGTVDNYNNSLPQVIYGKGNQYAWNTVQHPTNRRTPAHNIIRGLSGLTVQARALGNGPEKIDVWKLIFTYAMVDIIAVETNKMLAKVRGRISENTSKYN